LATCGGRIWINGPDNTVRPVKKAEEK